MDSVVGIDLSGLSRSTKSRTAAAALAVADPPRLLDRVTVKPGLVGDRELIDWVAERRPLVVAIDAPLTLPHSVLCAETACPRCQPGTGEYLSRDVDKLAGGMPTTMLAAIAFRGIFLGRALRERGVRVIETYPAAGYRELGAGRDPAERRSALEKILGRLPQLGPDELDATCAALAAHNCQAGGTAAICGDDGEIWLPAAPR